MKIVIGELKITSSQTNINDNLININKITLKPVYNQFKKDINLRVYIFRI